MVTSGVTREVERRDTSENARDIPAQHTFLTTTYNCSK